MLECHVCGATEDVQTGESLVESDRRQKEQKVMARWKLCSTCIAHGWKLIKEGKHKMWYTPSHAHQDWQVSIIDEQES